MVPIIIRDDRFTEVGSIRIPRPTFDRLVVGHKIDLEPDDLETSGGLRFSNGAVGIDPDRPVKIRVRAEINPFGGREQKWSFHTNKFGAWYIAMMERAEDAALFRLWVHEAARDPGRVASTISECLTLEDYRMALSKLRKSIERGHAEKRGILGKAQ